MPRIFLAVSFSVAVTRKIAEEVEQRKPLLADAGFRIAWVPAANLHVTMRFIGTVADELVEGIIGAAGKVGRRHAPFEARAFGVGVFPSLAQPAVLWVGVQPSPQLTALQNDIEATIVDLGFEKEARVFQPHVTVGRVKESRGGQEAPWTGALDAGSSTVSELVVYESKTRAAGAEYVARARVPLHKEK